MTKKHAETFIDVWNGLQSEGNEKLLKFLFSLFDLDQDNHVTKDEMIEVFKALYQYLNQVGPETNKKIETRVDKIFAAKDSNHDNKLQHDEFATRNAEVDDALLADIYKMISNCA